MEFEKSFEEANEEIREREYRAGEKENEKYDDEEFGHKGDRIGSEKTHFENGSLESCGEIRPNGIETRLVPVEFANYCHKTKYGEYRVEKDLAFHTPSNGSAKPCKGNYRGKKGNGHRLDERLSVHIEICGQSRWFRRHPIENERNDSR
jgi:hypothetical protein